MPVVCLTAYTAPVAAILDEVCDLLLVGDSVGMVLHGLPNTVGVTLEMMILHGQAVMRASQRAMVVVDMPFGSYEGSKEIAYANAVRLMKETGCPWDQPIDGSTGQRAPSRRTLRSSIWASEMAILNGVMADIVGILSALAGCSRR